MCPPFSSPRAGVKKNPVRDLRHVRSMRIIPTPMKVKSADEILAQFNFSSMTAKNVNQLSKIQTLVLPQVTQTKIVDSFDYESQKILEAVPFPSMFGYAYGNPQNNKK